MITLGPISRERFRSRNIINGDQAVGIVNGSTANLTSGGQNIHLYLVNQDSSLTTPDQLQGWIGALPEVVPVV